MVKLCIWKANGVSLFMTSFVAQVDNLNLPLY